MLGSHSQTGCRRLIQSSSVFLSQNLLYYGILFATTHHECGINQVRDWLCALLNIHVCTCIRDKDDVLRLFKSVF